MELKKFNLSTSETIEELKERLIRFIVEGHVTLRPVSTLFVFLPPPTTVPVITLQGPTPPYRSNAAVAAAASSYQDNPMTETGAFVPCLFVKCTQVRHYVPWYDKPDIHRTFEERVCRRRSSTGPTLLFHGQFNDRTSGIMVLQLMLNVEDLE